MKLTISVSLTQQGDFWYAYCKELECGSASRNPESAMQYLCQQIGGNLRSAVTVAFSQIEISGSDQRFELPVTIKPTQQ